MNATKLLALVAARSRRAPILLALLGVAAAAVAGGARADWLVLASGDEIETKGEWTLQGQKIVFTTTRGQLSSIRASSVDVASSRDLTAKKLEEANRVVVATPEPKRAPVLVLTNEDLDRARSAPEAAAGAVADGEPGGEGEGNGQAGAAEPIVVPASDTLETRVARQLPGAPAVRITSWSARPTGEEQLSVFGTVENVGRQVAAAISVTVTLIDFEGGEVGKQEAAISASALMPGNHAELEARFDGSPSFATVDFAVTVVELAVGRPAGGDQLEEPIDEELGAAQTGARPSGSPPAAGRASGDEPHSRTATPNQ